MRTSRLLHHSPWSSTGLRSSGSNRPRYLCESCAELVDELAPSAGRITRKQEVELRLGASRQSTSCLLTVRSKSPMQKPITDQCKFGRVFQCTHALSPS